MNNKFLTLSILTALLFSLVSVSASVSSVTTSASASTATTGTSVTITASITDTTSESASASIITSPSGVTVSDPSGGQYQSVSLSTSPTSKTFTITASSPNTYSYYVTSGGTPSTSSTIVFVNPSTLTLSGSPSSTTAASGGTFTESITISNPSSSSVTTSYTLSCPSATLTCTGDPITSSAITIAAGSSTTLSWTVTVGGTSSSATLSLQLGDTTNAFSTSVSCSNCVTTTTTTTTTDTTTTTSSAIIKVTPAGVKVATAKGSVVVTIPSIAAGKSSLIPIDKTEDVAFTEVTIFVANPVNNIMVTISKLGDKPASITQEVSGKVYHYIQIDKNNTAVDTAVNQTKIKFKVEKSWTTSNNVDESTVALYRYSDDKWNKLETTKSGEDTDNFLYEATSPGLSVFSIAGELKAAVPTTNETAETPSGFLPNANNYVIFIVIGIAAVGAIAYFVMKNKKGPVPNKRNWTDLKRKYSK